MARAVLPPLPQSAILSPDQMRAGIERLRRRIEDLENLNILTIKSATAPEIEQVKRSIEQTLAAIFGPDSHEYRQLRDAQFIDKTEYKVSFDRGRIALEPLAAGLERGRSRAIALLKSAITNLSESLELQSPNRTEATVDPSTSPLSGKKIFIVHGHDVEARSEVQVFLKKAGLEAVVLHEQANRGQTIIEKFETHATSSAFAVVILTPDDMGSLEGKPLMPRARQNVIAEMGWFSGKLGRDRVCVLKRSEVEVPSDFTGVGYVDMDSRGAWKQELARELRGAGFHIDLNEALS